MKVTKSTTSSAEQENVGDDDPLENNLLNEGQITGVNLDPDCIKNAE